MLTNYDTGRVVIHGAHELWLIVETSNLPSLSRLGIIQ